MACIFLQLTGTTGLYRDGLVAGYNEFFPVGVLELTLGCNGACWSEANGDLGQDQLSMVADVYSGKDFVVLQQDDNVQEYLQLELKNFKLSQPLSVVGSRFEILS